MDKFTDEKLLGKIHQALKLNAEVSEARLKVDVKNGRVSLAGEVPFYRRKLSAIETVEQIAGVKEIDDRIDVKPDIRMSDKEIEKDVRRTILKVEDIPETNIMISSKKGQVKLTGNLSSLYLSQVAETVAYNCEGVLFVENLILIDLDRARGDGEIAHEVEELLARENKVNSMNVSVSCVFSRLILRGTVESLKQKRRVHAAVAQVPGLLAIRNELEVG